MGVPTKNDAERAKQSVHEFIFQVYNPALLISQGLFGLWVQGAGYIKIPTSWAFEYGKLGSFCPWLKRACLHYTLILHHFIIRASCKEIPSSSERTAVSSVPRGGGMI